MNRKRVSTIFLILGIISLTVAMATNQTVFSWAAAAFVLLSLVLGGRWLRSRRK